MWNWGQSSRSRHHRGVRRGRPDLEATVGGAAEPTLLRAMAAFPLLLLLLAGSTKASAREPLVLDPAAAEHVLGPHMEILKDAERRWDIAAVSGGELAGRFAPVEDERPHWGVSDAAYWLRFSLIDTAGVGSERLLVIAIPDIDLVELYVPGRDGRFEVYRAGDRLPYSTRPTQSSFPAFPLPFLG